MTINTQGASQTLIEDQQANIKTLTELNLNQARTIENLQAQVKELEAAPIKINVKSRDVWITFNAGGGRQSMLCLNNIINHMHNEGITKGICLDAIRAALQENEL